MEGKDVPFFFLNIILHVLLSSNIPSSTKFSLLLLFSLDSFILKKVSLIHCIHAYFPHLDSELLEDKT